MKHKIGLSLIASLLFHLASAQEELTPKHLEKFAVRFELNEQHLIEGAAKEQFLEFIGTNQFVGIAEVHNSQQLSYFTTGFVILLKEKGFAHFALEMGPHSAKALQELSETPAQTSEKIRTLNRTYGKRSFSKIPLVFVDKKADVLFVEKASTLGYNFWGLDQEYAGSFEMHIDHLFELVDAPSTQLQADYQTAKTVVRKNAFKNKVKGQSVYCWYQTEETIENYFKHFEQNEAAAKIIKDLQISWDIYCKSATGKGSNQQRANYMKENFQAYYERAQELEPSPKVFTKLGGVHLTHGLSPFGVDDMGKFLTEKAKSNNTGFLSIRHLIAYRNGKSNVGRSGWKSTSLFLELGRKDKWTAVDLRPFRKMMEGGEIKVSQSIAVELRSYDILLLSPNDQYPKPNF